MTSHGYARVSTDDQTHASQIDALVGTGIAREHIHVETVSGALPAARRPVLSKLLDALQPGDTLAVARLDRLGRDPADVLTLLRDLEARGVGVRMVDMGADTATPAGRLVVAVLAAVAGWERDILRERTRAGMKAAKARGKHTGRRHTLSLHQRREAARMGGEGMSVSQVAALLGCAPSIAHRAMQVGRSQQQP